MILKDQIIFNGSSTDLKNRLLKNEDKEFRIEWLNQSEFKFLAHISLGTLIMHGNSINIDGIKGYGKIINSQNGKTKIKLSTKIRIELYFTFCVFLFIFFCGYMAGENFPYYIYLLLPVSILWFWFVYRVQEKKLFEKLKKLLRE